MGSKDFGSLKLPLFKRTIKQNIRFRSAEGATIKFPFSLLRYVLIKVLISEWICLPQYLFRVVFLPPATWSDGPNRCQLTQKQAVTEPWKKEKKKWIYFPYLISF